MRTEWRNEYSNGHRPRIVEVWSEGVPPVLGENGSVEEPRGDRRLTREQTAALMRRFHSRDTRPELAVRRALHAMGLRYRLHRAVPSHPRRTIDIAFPVERVAVFIDGCYWHGCPAHGKTPATNSDWWRKKIGSNVARDAETNEVLESQGWTVVRRWEHEDPGEVAEQVAEAVRRLRTLR